MIPLKDLNKSRTTPHVNRILILANIIVFVVYWLSRLNIVLDATFAYNLEQNFTMFPNEIIHGQRLYTLFTSMFMHDPYTLYGGLIHLFGNMLFLYVFGDNVEDVFGHAGYIFFYFVSGLLASSAYIMSIYIGLSSPADLTVGVIGASGAISGVLGAYLVLYPKARILTLVFAIWILLIPVPAIIFLGFWFLMQWFYGFFDISGGVAYWAHIGGFMAGMILALIFGLERKRAQEARFRL